MPDLNVTSQLRLPEDELQFRFVRSGGPGGQNVNKLATKAELRWRPAESRALAALPGSVRLRLWAALAPRLTVDGDMLITASEHRSREQNIAAALERLRRVLAAALIPPKVRHATRPTRGSRERRISAKKHRSRIKSGRQVPGSDEQG